MKFMENNKLWTIILLSFLILSCNNPKECMNLKKENNIFKDSIKELKYSIKVIKRESDSLKVLNYMSNKKN